MKLRKRYEHWVNYTIGGAMFNYFGTIAAIVLIIGIICTIGDDFMIAVYLIGFLFFLYLVIRGVVDIIRWILGR